MKRISTVILVIFLCACSDKEHSVMYSDQGSTNANPPISVISNASNVASTNTSSTSSNSTPQSRWSNITTPQRTDISVSDEAKKALLDLYGGASWNDKGLDEYFKGQTIGYITPMFEKRFKEGGKEKLLVFGFITDTEGPIVSCHACVPLIGGAIFVKQGAKLVVESENKLIGLGGGFGSSGDISIVQIGKEKYGVLIRNYDMNGGYESFEARVLVPYNGNLDVALEEYIVEAPSGGACEKGNAVSQLKQGMDVKFEPVPDSDYFEVVTRSQFNDGDCDHNIRQDKTTRYRLHDGKYEPV